MIGHQLAVQEVPSPEWPPQSALLPARLKEGSEIVRKLNLGDFHFFLAVPSQLTPPLENRHPDPKLDERLFLVLACCIEDKLLSRRPGDRDASFCCFGHTAHNPLNRCAVLVLYSSFEITPRNRDVAESVTTKADFQLRLPASPTV